MLLIKHCFFYNFLECLHRSPHVTRHDKHSLRARPKIETSDSVEMHPSQADALCTTTGAGLYVHEYVGRLPTDSRVKYFIFNISSQLLCTAHSARNIIQHIILFRVNDLKPNLPHLYN